MNVLAYEKAYRVLRECAANRRTIVGSDFAHALGTLSHLEYSEILDAIGNDCIELNRPVLTALVVQGTTGIPSKQFFQKYFTADVAATRFGTRKSIWTQRVNSVYEYYAQPR